MPLPLLHFLIRKFTGLSSHLLPPEVEILGFNDIKQCLYSSLLMVVPDHNGIGCSSLFHIFCLHSYRVWYTDTIIYTSIDTKDTNTYDTY
jgi:hypothetical protein